MNSKYYFFLLLCIVGEYVSQAQFVIQNIDYRVKQSLDGQWRFIIDPYETGYRDHRTWIPFDEKETKKESAAPYYSNKLKTSWRDRIEYDFENSPTIEVPGDFNHQRPELLYYEGTLWYYRKFDFKKPVSGKTFIHFGAVNYRADVYINGQKVGFHEGGFDPFHFDASDVLHDGENFIIVRVDNRREKDRVPGLTTDWWNYGGITRSVSLVHVPDNFIIDYYLQLDAQDENFVSGYVQMSQNKSTQVNLKIPELNVNIALTTNAMGKADIKISAKNIKRWYPERPKLYDIHFSTQVDHISDKIGFRTIKTVGKDVLLNGKKLFFRGICLHEENPFIPGRAHAKAEAKMMLEYAKELNANTLRLAHYPHREDMPRLADEMGFLLWEEVPVYWGIDYTNPDTYKQAANQLKTMVHRDKNRASVVIWSVANETPREDSERLAFLIKMKNEILAIDKTRFVSAALDRTQDSQKNLVTITDPFAKESNIISVNEYIGWYGSEPDKISKMNWDLSEHDKPLFISEFGAGAKYNMMGDSTVRWSEEYQDWMYRESLKMLDNIPHFKGVTPWILIDFRSPRRNLAYIKDGWNRKGLISNNGQKKKAFYTLQKYYEAKKKEYEYKIDN